MKIAVVTPHPTPYRDPFWNHVARQSGVELHVYYCEGVSEERPWDLTWKTEYRSEILKGFTLGPKGFSRVNPGIGRRLKQGHYDAIVVGGYNHVTMQLAMAFARVHHIPYFVMSEVYLAQPRASWKKRLKRPLVRSVMSHASGAFPTGSLAQEYLEHYGLASKYVFHVPNVPDVVSLRAKAAPLRANRGMNRKAWGLDERPLALFVGRLFNRKQPDMLIKAWRHVVGKVDAQLAVLGTGPMEDGLKRMVHVLDLESSVSFQGFIQPNELPAWYAASDLFVLPSSNETWGVVVEEAIALGVPVVVSDRVGCSPDIVNHDDVGTVVPFQDEMALADAMIKYLENRVSEDQVREAWAPVYQRIRYSNLAESFVRTIADALEDRA